LNVISGDDDTGRHLPPPALSKADDLPQEDKMASSLETLLLNILGLLKVAAANARNWEQKMSAEKGMTFTLMTFTRYKTTSMAIWLSDCG
jgi:hypothetical protein